MPSIRTLAVLDINGIGFSNCECEKLKGIIKGKLDSIERECYSLAGRKFSITSPDDVSRVLFVELGLPPDGKVVVNNLKRSTRKRGCDKLQRFSTSKAVLEKLEKLHGLPKLILEWRRLNSALTKVVYPLQRIKVQVKSLEMERIFSDAQYATSTGRIMFSEPNLQNVPREFDIKLPMVIGESPPLNSKGKRTVCSRTVLRSATKVSAVAQSQGEVFSIGMRNIFVPFKSGVFIAADYCQLELRIIAHLSDDGKLIAVLNDSADVFRAIAAGVHHVSISDVTDSQRQHAKHICYGIIYGMGTKTLAEQLDVSLEDAAVFMEQFKNKYSGVKRYIQKTIETTRKEGYVTTLTGRRRYLPAINSINSSAKSHAERQSVNTAVQGSAADLVKKAMNSIDNRLLETFGQTCFSERISRSKRLGAFFVLQLHDELLYEVSSKDVDAVAGIIRFEMENAIKLMVKIPVKIRVGASWGCLKEI